MRRTLIAILFNLTIGTFVFRQPKPDTTKDELFKQGVYFENLNVTVPWDMDLSDTLKYRKPHVSQLNKRTLLVQWDSVKILGGIIVTFKSYPYKVF